MSKHILRVIGGLQESWQKEAAQMYLERLSPYLHLDIIELPEGSKGTAKPDIEKTKRIEADSLLKSIPDNAWVVALDETGKTMTSLQFSQQLTTWSSNHQSIVFLIGGSWGLSEQVKKRADAILSFGSMTLPHALARIVLLEQLYRAAMISAGKTYHK